ncbi:unnamed protein product [Polarella glacialis]|uniref:Uncharacterized protein n=1 Tax=Polarella glacialis TaxID=89957 RepID=A0A813KBL8_POLGL|nr:unnamed protein product [Polarella glacialis]
MDAPSQVKPPLGPIAKAVRWVFPAGKGFPWWGWVVGGLSVAAVCSCVAILSAPAWPGTRGKKGPAGRKTRAVEGLSDRDLEGAPTEEAAPLIMQDAGLHKPQLHTPTLPVPQLILPWDVTPAVPYFQTQGPQFVPQQPIQYAQNAGFAPMMQQRWG